MKENWHKQDLSCQKCNVECSILELCFSSTGKVLTAGACPQCGQMVVLVLSWEQIVSQCMQFDKILTGNFQQGNDFVN